MPDRPHAWPLTLLAFDFGLRRIGIAAGGTLSGSAAPRPAARSAGGAPDWSHIQREISSFAPDLLIVGAPYNVDGSRGALTDAAAGFAAELGRRFGLPVEQVDERWSSLEAGDALKQRRASGAMKRRIRREDIDSAAAVVILERWLAGEGSKTI